MTTPVTPPPTHAEKLRQYAPALAEWSAANPLDALCAGIKDLYWDVDLNPAATNKPAVRDVLASQLASGKKPNIKKGRLGYGIA